MCDFLRKMQGNSCITTTVGLALEKAISCGGHRLGHRAGLKCLLKERGSYSEVVSSCDLV